MLPAGRCTPSFLKLLWFSVGMCACVAVCLCTCPLGNLITSRVIQTVYDWLKVLWIFLLLYMTLAIDKMDGCSLSNTACHECLPRRKEG